MNISLILIVYRQQNTQNIIYSNKVSIVLWYLFDVLEEILRIFLYYFYLDTKYFTPQVSGHPISNLQNHPQIHQLTFFCFILFSLFHNLLYHLFFLSLSHIVFFFFNINFFLSYSLIFSSK